jgi:hypothetical protein
VVVLLVVQVFVQHFTQQVSVPKVAEQGLIITKLVVVAIIVIVIKQVFELQV